MRLLVSVSNAGEASAAIAGGADIIDAKNPRIGALGAVTGGVFDQICATIGGSRPVTAALGDAAAEDDIREHAARFAVAGARYVKVGFAGVADSTRASALTIAVVRGAEAARCGVIVVAYADADPTAALTPTALIDVAARTGADGVLLDTADKRGPGLPALIAHETLAAWIDRAHRHRLLVAVAGKLTAADLPSLRSAGADIAGVRGAACTGGRAGPVSAEKVRLLREICQAPSHLSSRSAGTTIDVTPRGTAA